MPSTFPWLDYSEKDRQQAQRVIDSLREHDTRDELGIGTVRDALSDLLFPGATTIQTRPKYFLLVPWVYQALERWTGWGRRSFSDVSRGARRREIEVLRFLMRSGELEGVIGCGARCAPPRVRPISRKRPRFHRANRRRMVGMNNESVKIESKDLSIEDLFKDFYTVPDFQREFVWEREQVEKLLQDVQDEFFDEDGQVIQGPEYFLGSIVVCREDAGTLSLIDGQQRMTSIFLVLCAIRDLLIEAGESPSATLEGQIAAPSIDEVGDEIFRHRLDLQYDDSKGILKRIVSDSAHLEEVTDKTTSVLRIRSAYRDITEFLRVNNDTSAKRLKLFYATFVKRVKLIRIVTPSLTNALKVFETVNDRGVGLNAMDLLKNLLFMKTTPGDYPTLKQRWKDLIDTLDSCGEKPLRFLRYYVMAHFELDTKKPLREDDIYDWFTKNAKSVGLNDEPLVFLQTLIQCARAWSNFLEAKDISGSVNPFLKNLTLLSGAARQHFILLLAGRGLSPDLFSRLCRAIENLFFCYIITREPTRTFERNFGVWAADLRAVTDSKSLDDFIRLRFVADLEKRRGNFDFAFNELRQSRIQQYRMRYILAKLTQFIEQLAWKNPAHESLDQYIASTVEVEHILPQTPNQQVRDDFDRDDQYYDYVERMGNLTLLEKTINTSVSNDLYIKKLPGYRQSSYLLTKSLAEKPHVGVDTQLNRAVEHLISFGEWNSNSIERRQKMLARLAVFVWDMPGDRSFPDEEDLDGLQVQHSQA